MSQYPPPYPPTSFSEAQPVLPYQPPYASARPTSVTVMAIIGIVFGSLGLLANLWTVVATIFMAKFLRAFASSGPGSSAALDRIWPWSLTVGIVGVLMSAWLLWASIAAVRFRRWARSGLVVFSIADLVFIGLKLIVQFIWIFPVQRAQFAGPIGSMSFSAFQVILAIAMSLLVSVFPIVTIILFSKASVKDAFEQAGS